MFSDSPASVSAAAPLLLVAFVTEVAVVVFSLPAVVVGPAVGFTMVLLLSRSFMTGESLSPGTTEVRLAAVGGRVTSLCLLSSSGIVVLALPSVTRGVAVVEISEERLRGLSYRYDKIPRVHDFSFP